MNSLICFVIQCLHLGYTDFTGQEVERILDELGKVYLLNQLDIMKDVLMIFRIIKFFRNL